MVSEISECTFSSTDLPLDELALPAQSPKGLASIPDSISHGQIAPKPAFLTRIGINFCLIFLHMATNTLFCIHWILKTILGWSNKEKVLYRELHHISNRKDMGSIEQFLTEHSEESFSAGYLFSEFADLPELYPHFDKILQGANVCLVGDKGFFCRRWSEYIECYPRISSHQHQKGQCFAIGHFLFWLDLEGNTRFQFENSQWKWGIEAIAHAIDFLRYRRDNEQQGVAGSSPHTEQYCILVEIEPSIFISRKID